MKGAEGPLAGKGYFFTGTDTGVGKTWASLGLMAALQAQGRSVLGIKPVASGAHRERGSLINADAVALREQGSVEAPYELLNPFVYEPPVAPHIAARQAARPICVDAILAAVRRLLETHPVDKVVAEGIGGWRVPLAPGQQQRDLVCALGCPVILVVSLRLGCISHALLTAEAILADGLSLLGWVAARPQRERMDQETAVVEALAQFLPVPKLADIPHLPHPGSEALGRAFAAFAAA